MDDYRKIDEIPFDFNRRRLSIVVERDGAHGIERLLITKGAPEGILDVCESYEEGGQIRAVELENARTREQGLQRLVFGKAFESWPWRIAPSSHTTDSRQKTSTRSSWPAFWHLPTRRPRMPPLP